MAATSTEYLLRLDGKEVTITNPDKPLWPQAGITKLLYIKYLLDVSPYLLPYMKNRLLTVIRYPHGVDDKSFYQKNIPEYAPSWIATSVWENTRYVLVNDVPTLVWMANQAALEWHISFHEAHNEIPTELVFDLDPSTPSFDHVIEVAFHLKEVLDDLQLPSYPKTSGASGVQVYIPIERRYSFEQTRQVGQFVATFLSNKYPTLVTIERLVKNRGTKLYVDFLQHWRGKTLPAPYSTRARPEATVSTPVTWEELPSIHPAQFTINTVPARLKEKGDLFAPLLQREQDVSLDPILHFLRARR